MRWKCKVRPHGRVSFGFVPEKKVETVNRDELSELADNSLERLKKRRDIEKRSFVESLNSSPVPLGLSTPSNSQKTRRGLNGITGHAANQVRDAVWWLEQKYGKSRLTFATWTIPPVAMGVIQSWGEFVRLLLAKLVYRLEREGLPTYVVGVTEVQTERAANHGGLPLHLHWVFVGRHFNAHWFLEPQEADDLLFATLQNFCPVINREDVKASGRLESIKKSAVGYLGKYLSKGKKAVRQLVEAGSGELMPSSWHCCTRALRRIVAGLVKCYEIADLPPVKFLKDVCRWVRLVCFDSSEGERVCGGVGGLAAGDVGWVCEVLEEFRGDRQGTVIRNYGTKLPVIKRIDVRPLTAAKWYDSKGWH